MSTSEDKERELWTYSNWRHLLGFCNLVVVKLELKMHHAKDRHSWSQPRSCLLPEILSHRLKSSEGYINVPRPCAGYRVPPSAILMSLWGGDGRRLESVPVSVPIFRSPFPPHPLTPTVPPSFPFPHQGEIKGGRVTSALLQLTFLRVFLHNTTLQGCRGYKWL